jgi:Mrp family chromosome partitioning ATPase
MSSIEKALERLLTSKSKQQSHDDTDEGPLGSVETLTGVEAAQQAENKEQERVEDVVIQPDNKDSGTVSLPEKNDDEPVERRIFHLDYRHLKKGGYLTPSEHYTALAEEYRLIKRHILANAFGKGAAPVDKGNLVVITSSLSGEGKTYTSINLAMSMAMEMDSTVLLVDGDILKAEMSRDLGIEDQPGLMELLKPQGHKYQVSDVILSTDLPKLKIIPAGRLQVNSTELLASERMRQITEELSKRYENRNYSF